MPAATAGASQQLAPSLRGAAGGVFVVADLLIFNITPLMGSCQGENRFLVEHASTLLAVYNGVRRSGTGATVNYARKMGREIIVIDPITLLISHGESVPSPAHP